MSEDLDLLCKPLDRQLQLFVLCFLLHKCLLQSHIPKCSLALLLVRLEENSINQLLLSFEVSVPDVVLERNTHLLFILSYKRLLGRCILRCSSQFVKITDCVVDSVSFVGLGVDEPLNVAGSGVNDVAIVVAIGSLNLLSQHALRLIDSVELLERLLVQSLHCKGANRIHCYVLLSFPTVARKGPLVYLLSILRLGIIAYYCGKRDWLFMKLDRSGVRNLGFRSLGLGGRGVCVVSDNSIRLH